MTHFMQVVAHQDDDLLFMNPDLGTSIAAGAASVTVFLTAGQGSGTPDAEDPACQTEAHNALRAHHRQLGIMDAYARMAGVADADPTNSERHHWSAEVLTIAGKPVQRFWLGERPNVELVFLNLRDGGLADLRAGGTHTTVVPTGSEVGPSVYSAADVVTVLRALLARYTPTVVRAQDDHPDTRPGYTVDHPDHIAAARFAGDVVRAQDARITLVNYRDYNIGSMPVNLTPERASAKEVVFHREYWKHDASQNYSADWFSRMYCRWPLGTSWACLTAEGRPQAFVVVDGRVHAYGLGVDPVALADVGPLAPGVSAMADVVVARRREDHHIVSLGLAGEWTDLGTPNAGAWSADQVGQPVVVRERDGRVRVFVKNAGGGVSSWSDGVWIDHGGDDVQDGLAVVLNGAGCVEVFARSRSGLLGWAQGVPGGPFVGPTVVAGVVPASAPAAVTVGGRVVIAFREVGTERIAIAGVGALASIGGVDEPAMVQVGGGVLMFARDADQGVRVCRQLVPDQRFGGWEDLGGAFLGPVAAVSDGGRAHVFAIAWDGVLHVRSLAHPALDSPFTPWQPLA